MKVSCHSILDKHLKFLLALTSEFLLLIPHTSLGLTIIMKIKIDDNDRRKELEPTKNSIRTKTYTKNVG